MGRPKTSVSAKDVDKNSRLADTIPNIKFVEADDYDFPVVMFRCTHPVGTIMHAKDWLLSQYASQAYGGPEILRMEGQEVESLRHTEEGKLVLLESAAFVEDRHGKMPVAILALVMPKDPRVRFWYSVVASFKGLLLKLDAFGWIGAPKALEARTKQGEWNRNHRRVYTWMREEFLKAIKVPEHPDFLNAETMTDFAPAITNPDTALRRIEACESLYVTKDEPRDLSDDRYLLKLHPAERELASLVQVSCAEYLLIKRNFFKDWYTEVYRSDKKVKDRELVRTKHAHEQYMDRVYEWTVRRSRRLITGWSVLGLLDQGGLEAWVAQGGMLAKSVMAMSEEEGDGEGGSGNGAGKGAKRA